MTFYSDVNQQDNFIQDKIYDLEDIYQSIHNILNTEKGERLFLPEFGINLEQYLFEPMTQVTKWKIFDEIWDALKNYEPRITLLSGKSRIVQSGYHEYSAEIAFQIKGKVSTIYMYQARIVGNQKDNFYEIR